jgi:hypothetical protein
MSVWYDVKQGKHGYYYVLLVNGEQVDCSQSFGFGNGAKADCTKEAIKDKQRMEAQIERNAMAS